MNHKPEQVRSATNSFTSNRAQNMKIYPDIEGHDHATKPHPDGLGWRKACPECAHRTCDPQKIGDLYQRRMMEFDGDSVFYCLHRQTEDGRDRICACFAATHRLPQIERRT